MSDPVDVPLRIDGPDEAATTLVLAHGAGAAMDSPFLETVAAGLAGAGLRVVRFEFPYMRQRRDTGAGRPPDREPVLRQAWHDALATLRRRDGGERAVAIGGKSLGGRIASYVAGEVGARALVCLGYPFHPPDKPERLRTAHLEHLATETLIVQGTRDPFGGREEVAGYPLSPHVRIAWMEDGDHSFKPRKSSGRTEAQNLAEAIAVVRDFLVLERIRERKGTRLSPDEILAHRDADRR